jgi:hypothetical protein
MLPSGMWSVVASSNIRIMQAHKTTVTVHDHQVVVRLPDDFPAGEADVIVMQRPIATSPLEAIAEFDRLMASLPIAPVVALDSLDRGELNR